jgi:hypothetical protein
MFDAKASLLVNLIIYRVALNFAGTIPPLHWDFFFFFLLIRHYIKKIGSSDHSSKPPKQREEENPYHCIGTQ